MRRYPGLDRQWQVSDGGGIQPRWSRNSREIYYRSGQRIVAVTLDASGAEPVFGKPVALFADDYDFGRGHQRRELRRHGRRPVHHDSARCERRQAARRHQLDGRAEADPRVGWRAMKSLDCFTCGASSRPATLSISQSPHRLHPEGLTLLLLGPRAGHWLPVCCGHPSWRVHTRVVPPRIRRCKMRRVRDLWAPTIVLIALVGREGHGLAGPQQVRLHVVFARTIKHATN